MSKKAKLLCAIVALAVSMFSFACLPTPPQEPDLPQEPVKSEIERYYEGLGNNLPEGSVSGTQTPLSYTRSDDGQSYNDELWYRNDMQTTTADPTVIYIEEGDEEGWFYLYPTFKTWVGLSTFKSKDMQNWQFVSDAFIPDPDCWAVRDFWAPECIYDKQTKQYYLFFSATDQYRRMSWKADSVLYDPEFTAVTGSNNNFFQIGMAHSSTPYGPFKLYQNSKKRFKAGAVILQSNNRTSDNFIINYNDPKRVQYFADKYYGGDTQALLADLEPNPDYNPLSKEVFTDTPYLSHFDVVEAGQKQLEAYKTDPEWRLADTVPFDKQAYSMIDIHPYIDHDGQRYLYFVHDIVSTKSGSQTLGLKLDKNWTNTWYTDESGEMVLDEFGKPVDVYSSLTYLTNTGYYTVDRQPNPYTKTIKTEHNENGTNEGPYMMYNPDNGKYYLTVSVNVYVDPNYALVQAIGDSPLGPFRKLSIEEGGKYLYRDVGWTYVSGTGHHSVVTVKDKKYVVYHAHTDRENGNSNRGVCVDELFFVDNGRGNAVLYCNGPSYSLMPKIGADAKYRNIAPEAKLSVFGIEEQDGAVLSDGLIANHKSIDFVSEVEFGRRKRLGLIHFAFQDEKGDPVYRSLRAVMIFNAKSYDKIFKQISRIELDTRKVEDGKAVYETKYIEDLSFDLEQYTYGDYYTKYSRTLSSAAAEFDEVEVSAVRIFIRTQDDKYVDTDYSYYDPSVGGYWEVGPQGQYGNQQPVVSISEVYLIGA